MTFGQILNSKRHNWVGIYLNVSHTVYFDIVSNFFLFQLSITFNYTGACNKLPEGSSPGKKLSIGSILLIL